MDEINLIEEIEGRRRRACNELLHALLGSDELVERWWRSPNKAFGGDTPDQQWSRSPMSVARYIMSCMEGGW